MTSHATTVSRFGTAAAAEKYPSTYGDTMRERREVASLQKALASVPAGAHVLDLPCGTGRLIPLLVGAGFRVTAADSSDHMVQRARNQWSSAGETKTRFVQADVMDTGFNDGEFGAVICNRLFHHFNETSTRIAALVELRRISRGPIIVSFFSSRSLSGIRFRVKHMVRRTTPTDRIPIPPGQFADEAERAGLMVTSIIPVFRGVSPMCYLVLRRAAQPST